MVYLKLEENTKEAQVMLAYLKLCSFVEVIEMDKIPNQITLNAMRDAEQGKVTQTTSVKDLLAKLNK